MSTINRIGLFVRKDLVESLRSSIIAVLAVAGVVFVVYVGAAIFERVGVPIGSIETDAANGFDTIFSIIIYAGGLLISSRAFRESHDNARNHEWFMLPASIEEKFTARLLLTSVGFVVVVSVTLFLTSALAAATSQIATRINFGVFNPFSREALLVILNYFVVQSIFLLGATYFKRHHFIRTMLALVVFMIGFSLFAGVVLRLVYHPYFTGMIPTPAFDQFAIGLERMERAGRTLKVVGEIIYWAVIAPFCWFIAYLRLRETEVSDGV